MYRNRLELIQLNQSVFFNLEKKTEEFQASFIQILFH